MFKTIIAYLAFAVMLNVIGMNYLFGDMDWDVELPALSKTVSLPDTDPLHSIPYYRVDDTELLCMAKNIYHEARNQSDEGKQAVAFVTMNRVSHVDYPDTVCDVVYEPYQFSWTLTMPEIQTANRIELEAWNESIEIAYNVLNQRVDNDMYGVTHYHATYVDPKWGKVAFAQIDDHIFYHGSY